MTQRKSRGRQGAVGNLEKHTNAQAVGGSVEPPNLQHNSHSINQIASPPPNWQKNKNPGTIVTSPNLGSTYGTSNNLTLREQLYSVKNSMQKNLQFSQANLANQNRQGALQSPRALGSTQKIVNVLPDGPTQLSSKLATSSQETQASSMLQNHGGNSQIKFPMSNQEAARVLAPYLWEYEKREIFEYETIYYFNINERIKNQSAKESSLPGGFAYGKINE